MWKFNKTSSIEELFFNKSLRDFSKLGIDGLVRENVQNSLDAKRAEESYSKVKICLGTMKSEDLPGIQNIRDRISVLSGENEYTKQDISFMKEQMKQEEVAYLSFEDSNTKGLSGAERGSDFEEGDTYGIYAYKKGFHNTEEDQEAEEQRGGSHGIGKIASNAASEINVMYFANCDARGQQHLGGTVQLMDHSYGDQCYRSTGYFTMGKDGLFYPYVNDFHSVFEKKTRGLKVVIPFLREKYQDETAIVRAVCDNFFVAILNQKLEVTVNDVVIDHDSLEDVLKDSRYYPIQDIANMKDNFTLLYYDSYQNHPYLEDFRVMDKRKEEYSFQLYFHTDDDITRGRMAVVRRIGMKIEDFKVKGKVKAPYNAVLIPNSSKEDLFLKSMENQSHTSLEAGDGLDPEEEKNRKRFLNNLSKEVGKIIDTLWEKENPSDGVINTADLLYNVESSFRKSLEKDQSIVEINDGKHGKKKVRSKVKNKFSKKKEEKKKDKAAKKIEPHEKVRKNPSEGPQEKKRERDLFLLPAHAVKRILVHGEEFIKINIQEAKIQTKESKCNVFLKLIDGMGREEKEAYDISSSYERFYEGKNGKFLNMKGGRIMDVSIENDIIYLRAAVRKDGNDMLKFMYYLEV